MCLLGSAERASERARHARAHSHAEKRSGRCSAVCVSMQCMHAGREPVEHAIQKLPTPSERGCFSDHGGAEGGVAYISPACLVCKSRSFREWGSGLGRSRGKK